MGIGDDADEETRNIQLSLDLPGEDLFEPLSSLLNVEALLVADRGEDLEEVKELEELLESDKDDIYGNEFPASLSKASGVTVRKKGPGSSTETQSFLSAVQELGGLNQWLINAGAEDAKRSTTTTTPSSSSNALSDAAGAFINEATSRLDYLVSEASTVLSPSVIRGLVERASGALALSDGDAFLRAAERLVGTQGGLDIREAANLVAVLNTVLSVGFVVNELDGNVALRDRNGDEKKTVVAEAKTEPLFSGFSSAKLLKDRDYNIAVAKAAEFGILSGGIYQETEEKFFGEGHAFVANGTTADVAWIVSDSIDYARNYRVDGGANEDSANDDPVFVRTFTVRGYDASDETVDREELLITVCTATPEPLLHGVRAHTGLLGIARQLYDTFEQYMDGIGPSHRIVLNGHSVGGSLSSMLLLLMVEKRGRKYIFVSANVCVCWVVSPARLFHFVSCFMLLSTKLNVRSTRITAQIVPVDYVKEKVLRVFTYGSPPVFETTPSSDTATASTTSNNHNEEDESTDLYHCPVLSSYGLPSDIIYGYLQPWDPVIRLFSSIDPLYPLVDDLGEDGKTLYASGPARTLRPITRALIESWDGWPAFRETAVNTGDQTFVNAGIQHIFLPEPLRYVSDRLVSTNIQVPPVDAILRISGAELHPSLKHAFPLDTYRVSVLPTAIRSFVHHFYPAYDDALMAYAIKSDPTGVMDGVRNRSALDKNNSSNRNVGKDKKGGKNKRNKKTNMVDNNQGTDFPSIDGTIGRGPKRNDDDDDSGQARRDSIQDAILGRETKKSTPSPEGMSDDGFPSSTWLQFGASKQ